MSWVTVLWSMIAAACLTLAVIHGLVWCWQRAARANLLFTAAAGTIAVFALCELGVMQANSPEEMSARIMWAHVPIWLTLVALGGFVRVYLGCGRNWLLWSSIALRTVALVLNFTTGVNLNYLAITAVRRIPFLGEIVSVPAGPPNPAMVIAHAGTLALILFVADASVTSSRRGDRRKALLVGGSIVFFAPSGASPSHARLLGRCRDARDDQHILFGDRRGDGFRVKS